MEPEQVKRIMSILYRTQNEIGRKGKRNILVTDLKGKHLLEDEDCIEVEHNNRL